MNSWVNTLDAWQSECWKTKGCHSFDLSIVKTEDGKAVQSLCHLYPLANPRPASGVKGQCYVVGKGGTDLSDEAQEHDELPIQDKDASPLSQIPKKGKTFVHHLILITFMPRSITNWEKIVEDGNAMLKMPIIFWKFTTLVHATSILNRRLFCFATLKAC